jgi:hypothetical protein
MQTLNGSQDRSRDLAHMLRVTLSCLALEITCQPSWSRIAANFSSLCSLQPCISYFTPNDFVSSFSRFST